MFHDDCFFGKLKVSENIFSQSPPPLEHPPSIYHHENHIRQSLAPGVPVPSDTASKESFLSKAHDYTIFGGDTLIATGILVSCMSVYKGWEGYFYNYLKVDSDVNLERLAMDHLKHNHDKIAPDDICELYAHALIIAMARPSVNDDNIKDVFMRILNETEQHSQLIHYLGTKIEPPINWMRAVREQMQTLPRLKTQIAHFLFNSPEQKCKLIVHELKGADMATFKAALYFMYDAPKTKAHIQKYIVREMLLIRKYLLKIKSLPKEERELVALLYPGEYLPPIHTYSDLAFCTVFQYHHGEIYSSVLNCPHKEVLKVHVRSKLRGPLQLKDFSEKEISMLHEIDITEDFEEQNSSLLINYHTSKLEEMLKLIVAEIQIPIKDPVDAFDSINL